MMSDDKVGGWVKKGQNRDDVILECPLCKNGINQLKTRKKIVITPPYQIVVECDL